MPLFGIMNKAGIREDVPKILLSEVFMARDSENVYIRHGEARRSKGRLKEFIEGKMTGTCDVVSGSPTVTKATGTVWYTSATHYPCWGGDDVSDAGRVITLDGTDYNIKSVDSATQITLTTNYAGSTDTVDFMIGTNGDKVLTPDGNTIIWWHRTQIHSGTSETVYIFAFTADNIYLWDTTWTAWVKKTNSGGFNTATMWDVAELNGVVIATNNVDMVQYLDTNSIGNLFDDLGSASGLDLDGGSTCLTRAKYVYVHENYVHLGFTTEGGTIYKFRDRWCTLNDHTDWDETGTGDTGKRDTQGYGYMIGYAEYKGDLIVFFRYRAIRQWVTTGDNVFVSQELPIEVSIMGTHAWARDKYGRLYFLANDKTIRELGTPQPISGTVDKTMKLINDEYAEYSQGSFLDEDNLVVFALPIGDSATGNNKLFTYDPDEGITSIENFPVRAFGQYSRQSVYTIDTIPFATIDGIEWASIDTVENVVGYPLEIVSDYNGYGFVLHGAEDDDDSNYTGTFVLATDLMPQPPSKYGKRWQGMNEYKRLEESWWYFVAKSTGSVPLSYKEDGSTNWTPLTSLSMVNDGYDIAIVHVPMDLRARNFEFKLLPSTPMNFIGAIFKFSWDGDR